MFHLSEIISEVTYEILFITYPSLDSFKDASVISNHWQTSRWLGAHQNRPAATLV